MSKLTVCIDFDGVIHTYSKGWQDGSIYDDVVPGFFEWVIEAQKTFRLIVYSSRSGTQEGIEAMKAWMDEQWQKWVLANIDTASTSMPLLEYSSVKPAAFVTIDDRGICFKGDWSSPELQPEAIRNFKPWNVS